MGELESTVEEQRRTILEWQRAHGELQHGEPQSSQPSAGGVDEDIINELLEQVAFLKAELDRRHHHHRGHSASPRSPQASEANGERLDLSAVAAAATPPEQLLPSSNNPHRDNAGNGTTQGESAPLKKSAFDASASGVLSAFGGRRLTGGGKGDAAAAAGSKWGMLKAKADAGDLLQHLGVGENPILGLQRAVAAMRMMKAQTQETRAQTPEYMDREAQCDAAALGGGRDVFACCDQVERFCQEALRVLSVLHLPAGDVHAALAVVSQERADAIEYISAALQSVLALMQRLSTPSQHISDGIQQAEMAFDASEEGQALKSESVAQGLKHLGFQFVCVRVCVCVCARARVTILAGPNLPLHST